MLSRRGGRILSGRASPLGPRETPSPAESKNQFPRPPSPSGHQKPALPGGKAGRSVLISMLSIVRNRLAGSGATPPSSAPAPSERSSAVLGSQAVAATPTTRRLPPVTPRRVPPHS